MLLKTSADDNKLFNVNNWKGSKEERVHPRQSILCLCSRWSEPFFKDQSTLDSNKVSIIHSHPYLLTPIISHIRL